MATNKTYTIDENFAIKIFDNGSDVPFLYQPGYPNGDTFDSKNEAEIWAKLAIAAFEPDQPFAPIGKNIMGATKPIVQNTIE